MTTPEDPFASPASPGQVPLYGQPGYGQPGYGQPATDQSPGQPGYGPPPYAPGGGQLGYGPSLAWGPAGPAAPTEGLAIAALVCAVGSFVLFPVVPAVVGLVLAGRAHRSIAASAGRTGGAGLVTAARVLAWINLALFGVVVVVGLLALVLFRPAGIS